MVYLLGNIDNLDVTNLTRDTINKFTRDTKTDIIYNPDNIESKNKKFPLFYFVDYKDNTFILHLIKPLQIQKQ